MLVNLMTMRLILSIKMLEKFPKLFQKANQKCCSNKTQKIPNKKTDRKRMKNKKMDQSSFTAKLFSNIINVEQIEMIHREKSVRQFDGLKCKLKWLWTLRMNHVFRFQWSTCWNSVKCSIFSLEFIILMD